MRFPEGPSHTYVCEGPSQFRAAVVSPKQQDAPSFGSDDLGVIAMGVFHFSQSEDPAVNPVNGTQALFSCATATDMLPLGCKNHLLQGSKQSGMGDLKRAGPEPLPCKSVME